MSNEKPAEYAVAPLNSQNFNGEYPSPEAAATDYFKSFPHVEVCQVGRIKRCKISDFAPWADNIFDMLVDNAMQEAGDAAEDWLTDISEDAEGYLQKGLAFLLERWARRYGHRPDFWIVEDVQEWKSELAPNSSTFKVQRVETVKG